MLQGVKPLPSNRHSKVLPTSDELNVKLALVSAVGSVGFVRMKVSGPVVSTTQVKLAGVASILPAASIARTWKVCEPSARPL